MKIVAIDSGGTKTSISLYSIEGNLEYNIKVDTINVFQKDVNESIRILKEGILEIKKYAKDDFKIALGIAGYGKSKEAVKKIEYICEKALKDYDYRIFSDIEIALNGALNGNDGIVIIAGTGSIALAKKDEKYYRVGGFGYFLGDEGSGYYISKKILNIFTKQVDGRLEKTMLYNKLREELNLKDDYDVIELTKKDKKFIANLSKLIIYVPEILEEISSELSLMINTLVKNFDEDIVNVSYMGGVFNNEKILELVKLKCPRANIKEPIHSPEYGAFLKIKNEI